MYPQQSRCCAMQGSKTRLKFVKDVKSFQVKGDLEEDNFF